MNGSPLVPMKSNLPLHATVPGLVSLVAIVSLVAMVASVSLANVVILSVVRFWHRETNKRQPNQSTKRV